MFLAILTTGVLGTPCSTLSAFGTHGAAHSTPELAQACAIERAATQLRDWPPTNPYVRYATDDGWTSAFDQWAAEHSSSAAHQALQTELDDMCSHALATDLRFVGDYCNASTVNPIQTAKMLYSSGIELPTYLKWQRALEDTQRGIASDKKLERQNRREYVPGQREAHLQEQCTYAKAHGIEGINAYCPLFVNQ